MQYDYKTVLKFLDYPQRVAYSNPMTDRGEKVRWAVHSAEFHRLIKLVSKLPPATSNHVVRFIELYRHANGELFVYFIEERRTQAEKSTY